jgi:hypothetical protein
MNRRDAMEEIQKHSSELRELFYHFEEYTTQEKRYDKDGAKSVCFILPLGISLFFPTWTIVASIGRRYGVDLDVVDLKELELTEKGETDEPWISITNYKPAYIIKCARENEIKSALDSLKNSKKELNTYLEKVHRFSSRMKQI